MTRKQSTETGHVVVLMLVVVVLAVVGLVGWHIAKARQDKTKAAAVTTENGDDTTATPAKSTNNTSLDQDLQNINSSMGQENSDSNSANSGLNDQQNEVVVPTD